MTGGAGLSTTLDRIWIDSILKGVLKYNLYTHILLIRGSYLLYLDTGFGRQTGSISASGSV